MTALLDVRGLRAGYGGVPVLRGIDMHVGEGEAVGLFGPNGHGKTTLLRMLALAPSLVDAGNIRSSKLDALLERLDEVVAEGHRALVFSQFTSYLSLVSAALDAHGIRHVSLDGSTRDRAGTVDVLPDRFSTVGMWVVLAYFVLGIAVNAASRSLPERLVMVPVTLVLSALSLLVARG